MLCKTVTLLSKSQIKRWILKPLNAEQRHKLSCNSGYYSIMNGPGYSKLRGRGKKATAESHLTDWQQQHWNAPLRLHWPSWKKRKKHTNIDMFCGGNGEITKNRTLAQRQGERLSPISSGIHGANCNELCDITNAKTRLGSIAKCLRKNRVQKTQNKALVSFVINFLLHSVTDSSWYSGFRENLFPPSK